MFALKMKRTTPIIKNVIDIRNALLTNVSNDKFCLLNKLIRKAEVNIVARKKKNNFTLYFIEYTPSYEFFEYLLILILYQKNIIYNILLKSRLNVK